MPGLLPESNVLQIVDIMNRIVAIAGHTGRLIRLDFRHHVSRFEVAWLFFKGSSAKMAVEALTVIEGCIQPDFVRLWNGSKVFDVNVMKPPHL